MRTQYFLLLSVMATLVSDMQQLAITISVTRTTKALCVEFLELTLRQEIAFF
jgi:hypothetical protein